MLEYLCTVTHPDDEVVEPPLEVHGLGDGGGDGTGQVGHGQVGGVTCRSALKFKIQFS